MPKVDMVMETGTFVEWLKDEGEQVEKGEPLFVVLTDKANIEIEAPASGKLTGLTARADDVIPVTEIIGYILAPGESMPDKVPVRSASPAPDVERSNQSRVGAPAAAAPSAKVLDGRVRATPAARRLAQEKSIDLSQIAGRGPAGRIHKADVLAAAESGLGKAAPAAVVPRSMTVPLPQARRRDTLPMRGPRKIIAERLSYSAQVAPHINLSLRVEMSEAYRLRERVGEMLQAKTGHSLSFTAIIARAVAAVLPKHPYLNASIDGDEIILWEDIHLGIAASVEDYLVVPVIRDAGQMGLEQLVHTLGDMVDRVRQKQLTPAEMSGSTFTISNLGMFGIEAFTAIINPPETAILAVGAVVDVLTGDSHMVRPQMTLTLSADHRAVDGVAGARFLSQLKETLENPYLLI
jgi:pyruvate dehydrogenase E2 component (dihydrolipoamide acetyltransferase)